MVNLDSYISKNKIDKAKLISEQQDNLLKEVIHEETEIADLVQQIIYWYPEFPLLPFPNLLQNY